MAETVVTLACSKWEMIVVNAYGKFADLFLERGISAEEHGFEIQPEPGFYFWQGKVTGGERDMATGEYNDLNLIGRYQKL